MYKGIALSGVFFLFFIGMPFQTKAQYTINNIRIEGNVKTKPTIILRELPYAVGSNIPTDSLSILNTLAQQLIFNTSLFNDVLIATYDNVYGVGAASYQVQNFTGTGSQTVFTLSAASAGENFTFVYINGVYQQKNTYVNLCYVMYTLHDFRQKLDEKCSLSSFIRLYIRI
jgi:outer membrane protein assembly factor BamA